MSVEIDFKTLFSQVRRIGEITFDDLDARAQPIVISLLVKKEAYPAAAVTRTTCRTEIDPCSLSTQIARESSGEYETFNDGGQKKIVVDSVFDRMIRAVVATYSTDAPVPKIRASKTAFRRKTRARTPAELRGLATANARRREEALARREAKAATAEI
jgi:hypothetical protein